ncbi:unnamed protein product [Allacma fusca]|uniref:Transcription initiation factor IIA subunit 1 n=1 Tax=Allacma fusca TaxID=39272 RepID=A0A8J2LRQ3_9HEXA|nr:unnamed protein product [Allacma fusca]
MTNVKAVKRLYASVMEDVIDDVQEAFLDEGIDNNVLLELRDLWQSKMLAMDAIDPKDCSTTSRYLFEVRKPSMPAPPVFPTDPTTPIPVEIKYRDANVTTIQVPARCVADNKISEVLEVLVRPEIEAALSGSSGAQVIQDLVLDALGESSGASFTVRPTSSSRVSRGGETKERVGSNTRKSRRKALNTEEAVKDVSRGHLAKAGKTEISADVSKRRISSRNKAVVHYGTFLDGGVGEMSSDEFSSDNETVISIDNDDGTDAVADDSERGADDDDETPVNSADDDSEFENMNDVEVDNIVVCQYDKITRSRNKWKFHLKDGIMNINGKDHVFQKAEGYAEW